MRIDFGRTLRFTEPRQELGIAALTQENHSGCPGHYREKAFAVHMKLDPAGTGFLCNGGTASGMPLQQFRPSISVLHDSFARGKYHGGAPLSFSCSPLRMASQMIVPQTTPPEKGEGQKTLRRTGMNSAMVLSRELQEFTGQDMMRRPEVMSKICEYIREHNLYVSDSKNRFRCDDTLQRVLKTEDEQDILHIHKLITPQLTRPSVLGLEYEERADQLFKEYLLKKGAVDPSSIPKPGDPRGKNSGKKQKELQARGLGMYSDVIIAPCMRPLCNGKDKLSRPQALKAVWNYIKANNLQDEKNRRQVVVNDGLRNGLQIFDRTSIDCFHVSRYVLRLCQTVKTTVTS